MRNSRLFRALPVVLALLMLTVAGCTGSGGGAPDGRAPAGQEPEPPDGKAIPLPTQGTPVPDPDPAASPGTGADAGAGAGQGPMAGKPAGPQPGPLPGAPLTAKQVGTEWHYGPVPSIRATWGADGSLAATVGVEPNPLYGMIRLEPSSGKVTHLPYAWDRWSAYDLMGKPLVYATQREVVLVPPEGEPVRWPGWAYRISPDERYLVVFAEPNELIRVDLTDLALLPGRLAFPGLTWSRKMGVLLSWSPDGRLLALDDWRGKVAVIDTETWQVVAEPRAEGELQVAGGWSPDGGRLVMRAVTAETAPCYSTEGSSAPARKLAFYDAGTGKVALAEPAPGRWVSPWSEGWTRTGFLRISLVPQTAEPHECRAPALVDTYYYSPADGSLTAGAGLTVADLLRVGEGLWSPDGQVVLLHLPDPAGRERGNGLLNLPPVYGQEEVRQLLVRAADGQVVREVNSAEWRLGPWAGSSALVAAKPGPAGNALVKRLALLTTDGELKVVADLPDVAALPPEPISPDGQYYAYWYRTDAGEWLAVGNVK